MNIITAYQCEFCSKVYTNKETTRKHEAKCYYNPTTRSCASCVFLAKKSIEAQKFQPVEFLVCLMNHDISDKLRTGCPTYQRSTLCEETGLKTNLPPISFDEKLALERLAPKLAALQDLIKSRIQAQKTGI